MTNPLVAERKDSTQSFSGVPILESVNDTKQAIESGDWASGVMGAVGTGLDALTMAMDPFGSIIAAGVGWLMEHVGPLSDALDALTGDADQIKAHSETWSNVAKELGEVNTEMANLVSGDVAGWTGEAADAYRRRSEDTGKLIEAAQKAAEGASNGISTAGEVVAAVRTLVRDIIAELVGRLISWALQVLATLGIAMAWVVPQVVAAVAKTVAKIADLTTKLVKAMKALSPLVKKLGDSFGDAKKALDKIKNDKGGSAPKPDSPAPTRSAGNDGPGHTGGSGDVPAPTRSAGNDGPGHTGGSGDVPAPTRSQGNDGPASTSSTSHDGPNAKPDGPNAKSPDGGPTPGSGPATTTPSGNTPSSSNKPGNPRDRSIPADGLCTGGTEPVDLATGHVVMTETDLEILGPLNLVLERMHVSSYRAGRWFGPTWSSTLDQRLEIDDEHVCYFSADGMILVYPLPTTDSPVLPIDGPRWPLTLGEDGYTLAEPTQQLHFGKPSKRHSVLPLLRIEDGDGRRIDIEHTPYGPPKELRHSDGYHVAIDSEQGKPTAVRVLDDQRGLDVLVVRYGYDARGRLTEVVNSSGIPLRFDYDDADRLTGWQDRNGSWFRYIYDEHGRCIRTVGDKGFFDATISYDGRTTRHTNSLGGVAEYTFNDAKQLVREVDQLGGVTVSEWDRYDRLLSRTDPLGRTTSYEYDVHERPSAITRPDGSVVELFWDGGSIGSIAVHDGERTWTRSYAPGERPDPFGGKVGAAPDFSLDVLGSGPVGGAGAAAPDSAPEPPRDLFGRVTERTTAGGARIRHGWTIEGLPSWQVDARGGRQQWRYDPEGNQIARTDELGGVSTSEYGPFEVVTAEVDPTGARTVRDFDTERNLLSVTNPQGQTWHYTYDLAGRVVEERDFDGRVLQYAYDAAGQLVRSVNGVGEVTEYVHDLLGNLVEWRAPSGVTSYAYSPVGNLVRAETADAVLTREWDDQGRITAETTNGRTVTFTYDDENGTRSRTTPSGVDSVWAFDDSGAARALSIDAHAMSFEYDEAGREVRRSVDGSVSLDQSYEGELLVSQTVTGGAGHRVVQRRFEHRADGHLVGAADNIFGQARFQLDPAGRVVEVITPDRRERYRYDGMGNVIASEGLPHAEAGPRRYRGNTLVAAGSVGYEYDPQGRLVLRSVQPGRSWRYEWDSYDRLIGITTPDGAVWRYRYDPLGRRIAKQRVAPGPNGPAVAEQVDFVWDGGALIEQIHTDARGNRSVTTWEHHPDADAVVAQLERSGAAERFHSVVTDAVGKPTDLVAADGTLAWRDRTSLWGGVLPGPTPTATIPLRFPGQYADAETGLNYNVYRYYDPATGRYLSQDPLGLAPAPNPVAYVGNPHREADPLGLTTGRKHGGGSDAPAPTGSTGSQASNVKDGESGKPAQDKPDDKGKAEPPKQEPYKPPAADKPTDKPLDYSGTPAKDPGKAPEHKPDGPPDDRRRGAHVETLSEDRVTRNEKGLITHVKDSEGKPVPVKEYVQKLSEQRAEAIAPGTGRREGPCSAVAIDLRTGTIIEGVNGRPNDVLKPEDIHPVLRKNFEDLGHWQYPVKESDTTIAKGRDGKDAVFDGRAHHDTPQRHAEVKATNELLWERERLARETGGAPPTRESLEEMRFDPRWIRDGGNMAIGKEAPACANCDTVLRGVPSYTGRFSYNPNDYRYPDSKHSVETDSGL